MSRQGEMKEKYDKIRELQEQRDRREREAQSQSDELDAILEVSREAHGETPLVSASRLSGPGFGTLSRKIDPGSIEDAYSSNFEKSRFASPEAFSRNRGSPTAIPDGSISGMQQRTITAAITSTPTTAREPTAQGNDSTVTMTVKAVAPSKSEVTQVVRRRAQHLDSHTRREPPPVAPQNLAGPMLADGPAIKLSPRALPQLPTAIEDTPIAPESTSTLESKRVVFQRPAATPASNRMVTNRPANYGALPNQVSTNRLTHDTQPFGANTMRIVLRGGDDSGVIKPDDTSVTKPDGTSPDARGSTSAGAHEATSPGVHESTSPGAREPTSASAHDLTSSGAGDSTSPGAPERDTSPGMGDTPAPFERTSPGGFPGTSPSIDPGAREPSIHQPAAEDEADPFWRDDVDYEPLPVTPAARSPDATPTAAMTTPEIAPALKPVAPEGAENDARYKRVKEIDALIARFAADVEVKVGQGRENTFLRKRSEIAAGGGLDADDDFPDERTQPRHRNIEVRRKDTEIIPRRLPPRKRR